MQTDVQVGDGLADVEVDRVERLGRGRRPAGRQVLGRVVPLPDRAGAGEGQPGQLVDGEHGVLDEQAVGVQCLATVPLVGEGINHRTRPRKPRQVVDVLRSGALVDYDEEVEVGVVVETVELNAH